jgi:DNA-binding CsgD family transcriptional regulator
MTTPLSNTQGLDAAGKRDGVLRRNKDGPQVLQAAAIQMDALSADELPLKVLWDRLNRGAWRVYESFATTQRFYFVVESGEGRPVASELLLRTLLGSRQKVVAIDLERSQSTVTSRLGSALVAMGFAPQASRVPALLVACAVAAMDLADLPAARTTRIDPSGVERFAISIPRLDEPLAHLLTPNEFSVTRSLVDGQSYLDISRAKKRSIRTVANQIASTFRKLGVSGRPELLVHLATGARPR